MLLTKGSFQRRLLKNMNTSPLRGSFPKPSLTNPLNPSNPLRMSARCRYRKYRLDEESESIVKPEALEETQPPLADGKLNVVHQDRLSPGYCVGFPKKRRFQN